jgi:tetratricopeptide (TPR) repeat protein
MKINVFILIFALWCAKISAQPNCNVYKWNGDSICYQACKIYTERLHYPQGSMLSQVVFDTVIAVCPTFHVAYMEKAVPYLKRGDFATWRILIDKAVELSPQDHLGYRGWCRYQFLRDYKGALQDLNALTNIKPGNIGYSVNGDYHLNIAKALCHKGLGNKEEAIALIKKQLSDTTYSPGNYDYLHLGVLYLELRQTQLALKTLEKQVSICPNLAENEYYLAQIYRLTGEREKMLFHLGQAQKLYQDGRHRTDPYDNPMDRIYASDIEQAIKEW